MVGRGAALSNESPSLAFYGISVACLVISQVLAYFTTPSGQWPGLNTSVAFISIGLHWLVFIPSALLATEKFFDTTGHFDYSFLALYSLFSGGEGPRSLRQWVVTLFVLMWSVRLGVFLCLRIQRTNKDGRFDEIKHHVPRFFNMWTIQGCWVFLTMLPVFCLNGTEDEVPFPTWTDYVGVLCFGIGFACEAIADNQKMAFASDPVNEGKWISTGLWALSRHPNYFGEITLWTGIFLICCSVFTGGQWVSAESPLFVAFLLIKVSGIPLLEKRADQEWGEDPGYQEYKEAIPELVPWPKGWSNLAHAWGTGEKVGGLAESLIGDEGSGQQPIVEKSHQ